jgi:Uma2 family endonuclease
MATQHPVLALGPDDHGRLLTSAEFPDADSVEPWKYERVNGRFVVMLPDGQRHIEGTEPWLTRLVRYFVAHREIVDHVVPNVWIRVDDGTDRIGDLGLYLSRNFPTPPVPERIPDIMFEVVSPGKKSRDREDREKRADYQKTWNSRVCRARPSTQAGDVFALARSGYEKRVLTRSDGYSSSLLTELEIDLSEVS